MFGKEVIAASIAMFGDKPLVWRLPSVLFGTLGLFAFARMMWFLTRLRIATVLSALLLATNFQWFIMSRIAMLDMIEAGLAMVALWQFAAAVGKPARKARWHLIVCGAALGLSLGAKWSMAPLAVMPGLAFLILRYRESGWRLVGTKGLGPMPGISLAEAAFWLGAFPLALYWATFAPAFFYERLPVDPWHPVAWHEYMIQLQDSVKKLHPYRSFWYQWVGNWRAIWFLYENIDGAQRGIVLLGNPFSMLAGLLGLLWCAWAEYKAQRQDALVIVILYVASLAIWIVNGKPIQFYYHYLLPGAFLMGALALALDALWRRQDRWRWLMPAAIVATLGMTLYFYPIISAAELHNGKTSFEQWMWLRSWR